MKSRKALVRKLDKVFSEYIRKRDGRCVTCPNVKRLPLTCGHLFSRVAYSTRWDDLNCAAQCTGCNSYHEYSPDRFTGWFLRKHGLEKYELLSAKYHRTAKFSNSDLQMLIDEYKRRLGEEKK